MPFALTDHLWTQGCDTLILGVYETLDLPPSTQTVDANLQGALKAFLALKDFTPKTGHTAIFYPLSAAPTVRIILVGLGTPEKLDPLAFRKIVRACASALQKKSSQSIACALTELPVHDVSGYWKLRHAIEIFEYATYDLTSFKSKSDESSADLSAAKFFFPDDKLSHASLALALDHGQAIAKAVKLARDLGNTPPNVCTPEYLADTAVKWCEKLPHTHVNILSGSEMERLGMGAFMAVAKGSDNPPQLVVIEYKGGTKDSKPIALVGKGICFDSGGLSLKTGPGMMGMKYDMCGAASVLAAIQCAASLQLPINIVALMACAENMPSGHATRPDDVVTTLSGKTVEIANTDAEGRLVLCDTLTYTQQQFHPHTLIDVATLTGAVIVALGRHPSAVFSNQQSLADELIKAGQSSLDRVWQMPLWEDYQSQLDSPVADMCNIGGSEAGTVTAACFLSRFIDEGTAWAHLDVAGTAFNTGKEAHATGRPVPLLMEYLIGRAQICAPTGAHDR